MKKLWIIYYWWKAHIINKESSPKRFYIALDRNPDNNTLIKEVEEKQGGCDVGNIQSQLEVICKISVERVKYKNEPFENLELNVYSVEDGTEKCLGMLTTDIIALSKDIYQIAKIGSGLVKGDCDNIIMPIENNFSRLKRIYRNNKDIDSNILVFLEVYKEYKNAVSNKDVSLWENYGCDGEGSDEIFYIPVNDFKEIYEEMGIKKDISITKYKKYLSDNGYSKTNRGRNDYTHSLYGKVIALYIEKIKNELDTDNGKQS